MGFSVILRSLVGLGSEHPKGLHGLLQKGSDKCGKIRASDQMWDLSDVLAEMKINFGELFCIFVDHKAPN